jgi:hypothetical protein
MKKISVLLFMLSVTMMLPKQLYAQATRTWVSGVGDDANPCSRTAPCKTFAGAISKTSAGGEINVIDAGGYGTVTITKSITIDGKGFEASILASATTGIIINASATDVVIIRNLSINGAPPTSPGVYGIRYLSAGKVHIEDCTISNFGANPDTYPNTSSIYVDVTGKADLTVKNTTITSISSTVPGLLIRSSSVTDTALAVLDKVNIQGLGTAILAKERATVNVVNSVLSGNYRAVYPQFATSLIRLSNNQILNNTIGIGEGAGKVISFGNNQVAGNMQSAPPSTVVSQQ